MTGEKIRSLRRDHKPSKEEGDLLEPGDEEAAAALGGTFTGGRGGGGGKGGRACHKIFSNHHHRLPLKPAPASSAPPGAPALPLLHNSSVTAASQPQTLLTGAHPVAVAADGGVSPAHYPVHECVFKGDVRRLSSLIRTHNIGQKDNHGEECAPLRLSLPGPRARRPPVSAAPGSPPADPSFLGSPSPGVVPGSVTACQGPGGWFRWVPRHAPSSPSAKFPASSRFVCL